MIRIAITGPESSGKTTLARQLGDELGVDVAQEYAREFLEKRDGLYAERDLLKMAKHQFDLWENHSQKYLIADTEMLTFKIWSEVKFNHCDSGILELVKRQQFDCYLICSPEIPWEYDPLRENPYDREQLFDLYLKELKRNELNVHVIEGTKHQRLAKALKIIDEL